jgi:hypothetical protein
MMKLFLWAVLAVVILLVAGAAAAAFLLSDANRFKPRLEAVIAAQTGVPVTLGGDLAWGLWPPVSLTAEDVSAELDGQRWQVGQLALDLDALELIGNLEQWRVESLVLEDVVMHQEGTVLEVPRAVLTDLAPQTPALLQADLVYTADGQKPLPVTLTGNLSVDPATLRLGLDDTRFESPLAVGVCQAQAQPAADPGPLPPARETDLIPVATFRSFDWQGECALDWLQLEDQRFENVAVRFANDAGVSDIDVEIPRFFGGQATAEVGIDASREPVRWTVAPMLAGVDSRELLAWLDQRFRWAAPLAYGGTLRFEGNSADALLASLSGETRFDGGQGHIDIATIRAQLLSLATMFDEGEHIAAWPEVWAYQRLVGTWRIDRQQHLLEMALDNLSLTARGDYRPATDEIDMVLELVFGDDPALPVFPMNPLLYDLPIPVRCRGTLDAPTCRLDENAAQRIVAQALAGGEGSELRTRLEQKIDEEVPEPYRDAARSLLDMLGTSLERQSEEQ